MAPTVPHLGERHALPLSADHHGRAYHRWRRRRKLREREAPGRVDFSEDPNPREKVRAVVSGSAIGSSLCLGRHLRRNERRLGLHWRPPSVPARLFCVGLRWQWHHLQPHRRRNHPGPFPRPDKSRCPPVPFPSLLVLAWRSETGARSKLLSICGWSRSDCDDPPTPLGLNSQLYRVTEVYLYRRLTLLLHDWQNLSPTLAQLLVGGFSRFSLSETHCPFLTMRSEEHTSELQSPCNL